MALLEIYFLIMLFRSIEILIVKELQLLEGNEATISAASILTTSSMASKRDNCSCFQRNVASIASPLYNFTAKEVLWNCSVKCHETFDKIKTEITKETFLVHYNKDLPVKLVCDASQVGLGAVLAHIMEDGTERPIAFASRLLNKAEQRYSQIEKEGLALVYGVKKFHMYLYGRTTFTLVTDHKPLLAILGPKKSLPEFVAARLHRWSITLAAYNYGIEYRSTAKMGNACALSRLPVDQASSEESSSILLCLPLNNNDVLSEQQYKPFTDVWSELSVVQDCILRKTRVIIPDRLKGRVLAELHAEHQGIVLTKAIARTFVWWPGIDNDITTHVRNCEGCAFQQNNPAPCKTHPWETPSTSWQRVHIDFAGPFRGHTFLIVVDSFSKWPEVIPMISTTAYSTVRVLMSLFATHGIPEQIVLDNGPQFVSSEFDSFCKGNNIKHIRNAPYHSATNGETERFVQTFKSNMKCRGSRRSGLTANINRFLLSHRTTPHATTGCSPSFLLMGKRVRCRLVAMTPKLAVEQTSKTESVRDYREFNIGDKVLIRSYTSSEEKWFEGQVVQKLGKLHYMQDQSIQQEKKEVKVAQENMPSDIPKKKDYHEGLPEINFRLDMLTIISLRENLTQKERRTHSKYILSTWQLSWEIMPDARSTSV
nr:uncharacterized protein K02A2.6-like [Penaeus vannamei]